mgnify:CR=1 FL=1
MRSDNVEILGIRVTDRKKEAGKVQETLTTYGCAIKTRLGLHETSEDFCSSEGIILLELFDEHQDVNALKEALKNIEGVKVAEMAL